MKFAHDSFYPFESSGSETTESGNSPWAQRGPAYSHLVCQTARLIYWQYASPTSNSVGHGDHSLTSV